MSHEHAPSAAVGGPAGLLVVAIDRLPAWILPAYGATWVAMPRLDALAARGIVFDRAIATTDDPQATLHDLLGGGATPAVVAAAAAREWHSAFVTDDAAACLAGAESIRVVAAPKRMPERDADATCLARLCNAARDVVAAGRHRLVVVHATSLGTCWDAPAGFREAYLDPDDPPPPAEATVPNFEIAAAADPDVLVGIRQAFAGQLTLLDRCLGDVVAAAEAAGWTVVVAGLRGLALGLHGRVGPSGGAAFGELVHVPVIMADAASRMAGQRCGAIVVPADVGVTLGELLGAAPEPPADGDPRRGASLVGLFTSWSMPRRDRAVAVTRSGAAIATPAWHCVALGDRVALYAKPDDYFEVCDVANRSAAVAEELGGLVAAAAAGDAARAWRSPLSAAAATGGS